MVTDLAKIIPRTAQNNLFKRISILSLLGRAKFYKGEAPLTIRKTREYSEVNPCQISRPKAGAKVVDFVPPMIAHFLRHIRIPSETGRRTASSLGSRAS